MKKAKTGKSLRRNGFPVSRISYPNLCRIDEMTVPRGFCVLLPDNSSTGNTRRELLRDIRYPMEAAILFYDGEGNLLRSSDDDVMYFGYYTQEEWDTGEDDAAPQHFGWIDISEAIFEKLEMAAQAKELQIEFSFPDDFTITADEGRIAQVVENFASNAVKYTPVGGHILVKIQTGHSGTTFSIENDSAPFSDEALRKVWDTFYRVDEARSGGGTGLGLAIAKNIVELHGGKCSVRNTKTGVEFGFTL